MTVDDSQAARPYAAAAFAYARENNAVGEWGDGLQALAKAVSAIYAAVRGRQLIADKVLAAAADEITDKKLDAGQKNFLAVIAEAGRLALMPRIADMYEDLRLAHDGVVRVRVETAMPMSRSARSELHAVIERWLSKKGAGKKAQMEYEDNPALIGGVRAYAHDDVLDASILGRLNNLKESMR